MQPYVNACTYRGTSHTEEFQQLTCWLCCRFQGFLGFFPPKDDCFSMRRSLRSALQRQGSSLTHTDCTIQGDIGTQIHHLFPVISACLGTGGLQTRCCHVCSLEVWGLCYKDQNSEFFLISVYCHLLGVFFLGLGNSAEEWVFLLVLPTCTPLQFPVAMEISLNTRGHGTGSVGLLLCFRSSPKCGGRNSAGSSQGKLRGSSWSEHRQSGGSLTKILYLLNA